MQYNNMRREGRYTSTKYNYNANSYQVKSGECDTMSVYQLQRLAEHRYSAAGKSILEPHMNIFWIWLIEKVPLYIAPNTITLVGLLANIFSTLLLVWYSPDAKSEVPPWAMLACALGLFIYQTMDAIDGKQARRTNSSSPLGELFDHGCDAVSIVFVSIALCIALGLGTHPQVMFFSCSLASFIFYCAHWQSYVSGVFRVNTIDVTEGQMCAILIYVISAIFGVSIWHTTIPGIGIPLKLVPVLSTTGAAILASSSYFSSIFTGGVGKNGATCADTSVISPIIPISLVVLSSLYISVSSPTDMMDKHPCVYMLTFGLLAAKVTNVLVVAHMSRSELAMFDSSLYAPLAHVINLWLGVVIPELWLLWAALIFAISDLLYYAVCVCQQICDYLGIYCFRVSVFHPDPASRHHSAAPQGSSRAAGGSSRSSLVRNGGGGGSRRW